VNATRNVIMLPTYGGTYASSTCSTVYCHSNGQVTPTYVNPNWTSTTSSCTTCHGGDSGQASIMASNRHGSHMNNAANLGTNFACSTCHAQTIVNGSNTAIADYSKHLNKNRDVSFGQYSGTASGTSPAITCSNTRCHASRNPLWNAAATTDHKCTKCHGAVGVTNPTAAQMAPGNGRDLDGSNTMTSPTKDIQVGAHQQHLGGTGSMSIATVRCIECHTVPSTATANNHLGRRAAEVTFNNATSARKNGVNPAWTASSGSIAGTCANVYCHGAAMPKGDTSGTFRMAGAKTVFWNQTSLLASRTPSPTTCGVCHGAPPTAGTTASTHASYVGQGLSVCNQCHNHINTNGTIADVTKHINGSVEALTGCNACHDYDTVGATFSGGRWTGGSWGKSSKDGLTPNEGWGAHAKHINYIKNLLGIAVALNPTSQTFGVGEPANICGSCHTNNVANHTTSGSTVRTINFGDSTFRIGGAAGASFQFGTTNPVYDGASGTSSAITPKTCSNISCHYFTTPIWSTY
jgi:predicted CxxxxCH...CXXCH cytochrome family protein